MKHFSKLLGIGITSGLILGGVLGIVQQFTNKKVYLLLMNVDYIPIVKDWNVGPVMGFIFHLIVSVAVVLRSEEHTSELQSRGHLVCRLLLEKKNISHILD